MASPRLLLIDDSPEVATLVRLLARRSGQVATVAASAEAGLNVLAAEPDFDLLLVDVNLPGMDGIELCRRLVSEGRRPAPTVFIQSGLHDDLGRAMSVGVESVLYKDVLAQPELWRKRTGEILAVLAGRRPEWLLRCQQAPPPAVESDDSAPSVLRQALQRGLGTLRAAILGPHLFARAAPPSIDAPTTGQFRAEALHLVEVLWRLLGEDETRAFREELEPLLPGISGAEAHS